MPREGCGPCPQWADEVADSPSAINWPMVNAKVEVRPATVEDLSALNDIYNQYVAETHYTFDVEPIGGRAERVVHGYGTSGRYRVVVAAAEGVVGYASSSRFRPKPAYRTLSKPASTWPPSQWAGARDRDFTKVCSSLSRARMCTGHTRESRFLIRPQSAPRATRFKRGGPLHRTGLQIPGVLGRRLVRKPIGTEPARPRPPNRRSLGWALLVSRLLPSLRT
jgi:hypothetical protein